MKTYRLLLPLVFLSVFVALCTESRIPAGSFVGPAQARADNQEGDTPVARSPILADNPFIFPEATRDRIEVLAEGPRQSRSSPLDRGGWTPLEVLFAGASSSGLSFAPDGTAHFLGSWNTEVVYRSRRDGSWSTSKVILTSPSRVFRLVSTVSPEGAPWFAYSTPAGDGYDIYVGLVSEGALPERVSPDNVLYNFAPKLAMGQSTAWLTWYGGADTHSTYNVYVKQWTQEGWQDPVMISEGLPGDHWFSSIAVDSADCAHLVWGDSQHGVYYYTSSIDGVTWSDPFVLNPTLLGVYAAGWPACSIACDESGQPHVSWVGQDILPGGALADWDIYYSGFDGSHWTSPRKVNDDNATVDAYPELRIGNNNVVWIAWMDGDPASLKEQRVRVARSLEGRTWTEWRLDNDGYYYDGPPSIGMDPDGVPWVVWSAASEDFLNTQRDVLVTHYDATVSVSLASVTGVGYAESAEVQWIVPEDTYAWFEIERSGEFAARIPGEGTGAYRWVDTAVFPGQWTYRVAGIDRSGARTHLGSVDILVGTAPDAMILQSLGQGGPGGFRIRIGVPRPSVITLEEFNVQGRLVAPARDVDVPSGWSEITWDAGASVGSPPPAGITWLVARGPFGERVSVRLLRLPE